MDVILLYYDGDVKRIPEERLSHENPKLIEYLAVKISEKQYAITTLTSILFHFAYAKITYQLMGYTDEVLEKYDDVRDNVSLVQSISVEIHSIGDLLGILNCITRLDLVNYIMRSEETVGSSFYIGLYRMNVKIYDSKDHVIFDKKYDFVKEYKKNKGVYDPSNMLKVAQFFQKICPFDIASDQTQTRKYIYINDQMKWDLRKNYNDNGVYLVPLTMSNSFAMLTKAEMIAVSQYHGIETGCYVVDVNSYVNNKKKEKLDPNVHSVITKYIQKNQPDSLAEYIGMMGMFIEAQDYMGLKGGSRYYHVDVIVNLRFIIDIINIVFHDVYGDIFVQEDAQYKYYHTIDTLIRLGFYRTGDFAYNGQEIYFNHETLINPEELFFTMLLK